MILWSIISINNLIFRNNDWEIYNYVFDESTDSEDNDSSNDEKEDDCMDKKTKPKLCKI